MKNPGLSPPSINPAVRSPARLPLMLRSRLLLLTASLLSLFPLSGLAGETVRLRADYWMPMNGEPDGEKPGYVIEMARAIFEPQGIKVDYQKLAWDETLKACRAGEIEGAIGASRVEGEGMVLPTHPIGRSRIALWVRKDQAWSYSNTKSLEAVRIGAIQSYSYWPEFDEFIANSGSSKLKIYTGDSPLPEAIRELKEGAIVAMPETMTVFIWNVRELGYATNDFRMAYVHEGDDFFVAFAPSETGRRYAKLFDEGIAQLRKSGEFARILQRYGLSDWQSSN